MNEKGGIGMPSLLIMQWGVVAFFVGTRFLLGFMRGTSKSTFYLVATVATTLLTFYLISLISLNLFLSSSYTFFDLVSQIAGMANFQIPAAVEPYITDPALVPFAIAIIDLVLRIVAYIVLYPILKGLLTLVLFVPIWKYFIKKPLLARQNDKARVAFEEKNTRNKKFVPSKRLKKTVFSRLGGALAGGVHGFVLAFVFLLPVLIFAGFITGASDALQTSAHNPNQTLSAREEPRPLIQLPTMVTDYLAQVEEMNQQGLGMITRQIIINDKPIDRLLFDMVFTTKIVIEDQDPVDINWIGEVEGILGIANIILQGGYLEDGYDYNTISSENLGDIEQIFTYIGQSNIISYMIPFATRYGAENLIPDLLGYNPYDRPNSANALNEFTSIDWTNEFGNIYGVIEALLEFGSVGELMNYASNPELIFELSPEEGERFANIIRAMGELDMLVLISAAADYATTLADIQSQITWIDEAEREAYLQDRLSFILENPQFFIGETGEISRLADLIQALFTDDYDVNLASIVANSSDPATYLDPNNSEYFVFLLEKIVNLQILMETIPFAIDFGVYSALGDQVERELADQIVSTLETVDWSDEILNIGDIYKEIAKLGLASIFGENPDYFALVDEIALNRMDIVRTIVSKIFEESEVVNAALELASPIVLNSYIEDPELKTLVEAALDVNPESGAINFSFGREINNILTIIETIYQFTTISDLMNMTDLGTESMLEIAAGFGSLSNVQYNTFKNAFEDLQILSRIGNQGLQYAKDTLGIAQIYVPSFDVNLGEEITSILGLVYYAAKYLHEGLETYDLLEDIDFSPLFADPVFRSHLLATELNNHSNLLLATLAYNIQQYANDETISQYLSIPAIFAVASPEAQIWQDELNALLGAIFDVAASFESTNAFNLSIRDVLTLAEDPTQAKVSLITRLSNPAIAEATFGSLDSSVIFRSSIKTAIDTFGATTGAMLGGYEVKTPLIAVEDDMLKTGMFVELISGIASLLEGMNDTLGYSTVAEAMNFASLFEYVNAYNLLDDADIEAFAHITLLRGFVGDALLNPDFQAYARTVVANTGFVTPSDSFLAFERPNNELPGSELAELFIAIKALQITEDFYNNPTEGIYAFLHTFDQAKLDAVFDGKILKELFTFALADEGIINSLADLARASYEGVQSSQALLGQVNPNFEAIIGGLGTYRGVDGLFDTNELKAFIIAFNELGIYTSAELSTLSSLPVAHSKIYNTTVIEKLFQSNWLYDQVNYVFTNEDFYEQLAVLASEQVLAQTGFDKTFTKEDVSFTLPKYQMIEVGGAREGGIKVSEIKKFLLAGTRLDWTSLELGSGVALAANLSGILLETGADGNRHIDVILESNLLVAIFDKVLNFEYNGLEMDEIIVSYVNNSILAGNPTFDGLTLEPTILHYDTRAYDENQVLRRQEIIEMVEALSFIDVSAPLGIETFYNMTQDGTFDEFFDSYIIHSLISNVLNNEQIQTFGVNFLNNLQEIVTLDSDFLSVDPVLMDGDLFKKEEIANILIALHALGLTNSEAFGSVGLETFSTLNGRNIDPDTNEDDFDRVFKAHYIYIILDRALKIESLGDYVGQVLGEALGITIDDLDLTPHPAMLGTLLDSEVEVGRVPKAEFRRMFISFGLLGDLSGIGLNTFTDMIDPYEEDDDFSIFIASDFIYIVLARLFSNEGFGDYIGGMLSGVFGDDEQALDMTPPSDAKGQVVGALDEDVITRDELRNLMVSFKLLGDIDSIGIGSIMGLLGANIDPDTQEDDMDRFLRSIYLQDKISILLQSEAIIEMIANGLFDPADFELPASATINVDGKDRLTKNEIYKIFVGLNTIGIVDEDSLGNINQDTLLGLSGPEIDTIVDSDYLYTLIDLILKSQDTFAIPLGALNPADDPNYPNKIKKSEIKDIFKTLEILEISDFESFDPEGITIEQIKQILDETDSVIVLSLVSEAIIQAIDPDDEGKIPVEAFNGDPADKLLTKDEIEALVDALSILADGDDTKTLTEIDFASITVGHMNGLKTNGSLIIKQQITTEIVKIIDPDDEGKIPLDAYVDQDPTKRFTDDELNAMIDALNILANHNPNTLVADISTDVTVGQVKELKGTQSFVIKQLVSDAIIDAIGVDNIPLEAYVDQDPSKRLTDQEIDAMIDALGILGEDSDLVTEISTDVTIGQAKQLKGTESFVIKQLVSDAIIDAIGVDNIPLEAYIDLDPNKRLTDQEIDAMIDALAVLGDDDDLVTDISTDVTVGQALGMKGSESYIIQQLLSDAIVDAIGAADIPLSAYIDGDSNNRLLPSEIDAMIDALYVLANEDEDVLVTDITTDLTIGQLKGLNNIDSIIMKQLMSDQIVDAVGVDNVPLDAYIDGDSNNRLTNAELTEMINALEILAGSVVPGDVDHILVADVSTDVTVGQTKKLNAENNSLIIKQIISDAIVDMIGAANVPVDAYIDGDSNNRLTDDEISEMLSALDILADGDDSVLVTDISTDITIGQLKGLNGLESLIIQKLISDSIIDAVGVDNVPLDAYIDGDANNNLTQAEIDEMIKALEILAGSVVPGDVDHILLTDVSTDVTVGQTKKLDAENNSLIIKQIISDAIVEMIGAANVPAGAYIDGDSNNRLTNDEISEMIGALDVLSNGDDDLLVTAISTDITIGQLKDLNGLDSLIIQKLISDSIIEAVGVANVPDDAYIDDDNTKNLKQSEIDEMILALEILAGSVVPGDVDHVLLIDIDVDPTVGQTQQLKTNGSVIIKQIISDAIVDMLVTANIEIPLSAYRNNDDEDRLTNDEIGYMIDALYELSGQNNAMKVSAITFDETALSVQTLKDFDENSLILNRVISTALIQNIPNMPIESFVEQNPLDPEYKKDVLRIEIDNLLEALDILGLDTNGAGSIGAADITFTDIDTILLLGTVGSAYEHPLGYSPIIVHIMSTPMVESVSDVRGGFDYGIPSTAYRNEYDLTYDEVVKLVEALKYLGNVGTGMGQNDPDTTSISAAAAGIDATGFGPDELEALLDIESLIIYRMISTGINDANLENEEARAVLGDINYDPELPLTPAIYDIKIGEMEHLVVTMNILGLDDLSDLTGIDYTDILGLTDEEIDELLDNTYTIIYYIIDDIIQGQPLLVAQLDPSDFEAFAPFRIKRASLITLLKNNN